MIIRPEDILNEIRKRPPLQRVSVMKKYRGIKVFWELKFDNAHEAEDCFEVWSHSGDGIIPHIVFSVPSKDYPELNILNEGRSINVDGKINIVESEGHIIKLRDVSLKIVKEAKKEKKKISEAKNKPTRKDSERDTNSILGQIILHKYWSLLFVFIILIIIYYVTGISPKDLIP